MLLRCELTRDGARGFGIGTGCSGMVLMTWDGRRQVGIGRIGVDSVTVVTLSSSLYEDYNVIYSPHVSSQPDISTEPSLLSTSVSTSMLYMVVSFFFVVC